MKNLVITDKDISTDLFINSVVVNLNNLHYCTCTGGFECFKNNGICHFKDDMNLLSRWMNDCQLIIYVTKVKYGCFDIPFKRMLERMLSNLEPFYTLIDGESQHIGWSQLKKRLIVIGYGEIDEEEKAIFKDLVEDSAIGFIYSSINTYLCEEDEIEEALRTFGGVDHE
jgi:multimeric flavodoxin WrbA